MPIRLCLRTNSNESPFRDMLHALIKCPVGDIIILCTGFIQQPSDNENFYYPQYKILDDELLKLLKKGCNNLIIVAGKLDSDYSLESYENFVKEIENAGIKKFEHHKIKDYNWHAKIAIRMNPGDSEKDKLKPVACIIGSSNLTAPAYAIDYKSWNFEGDALIWVPDTQVNTYFSRIESPPKIGSMDMILNPEIKQADEAEQILAILKNIADITDIKLLKERLSL